MNKGLLSLQRVATPSVATRPNVDRYTLGSGVEETYADADAYADAYAYAYANVIVNANAKTREPQEHKHGYIAGRGD